MIDTSKLTDEEKVKLIENRWADSESIWDKVKKEYAKNRKFWANQPDWLKQVPTKRSKARSNRIFLGSESVLSNLLGRPSKPNVVPGQDTDEAYQLAEDLQDYFLEKYRHLEVKSKMRRGLRFLLMSRLIIMKVVWDRETDDFGVLTRDSRNIRFSRKSNSMYDTEFAIEEVPDMPVLSLIDMFPEKKKEILEKAGVEEKEARINNPNVKYKEAWLGEEVVYSLSDLFLGSESHPYWDNDGLLFTQDELLKFEEASPSMKRALAKNAEKRRDSRSKSNRKYESWLYNYFDKPLPPYIFGSMLKIEDGPVGASSLIEQVIPLQEEIDKRKRQISDNAETMGNIVKVDTRTVEITKSEAQQMKSDPKGLWYGPGAKDIVVEPGKDLPRTVQEDMLHSTAELDNIFGTQPTFRGEKGTQETATGRAILREQSFQRLDELVDLVDSLHTQLYSWWLQMMRVRYTETHYQKVLGGKRAGRVIEFMRNDLLDGVEVRVVPGQVMPDDRIFKAERAKEDLRAGAIDPLTYFEETQRDNPEKLAKRLLMYKTNPFSVVPLDPEDLQAIQEANALLAQIQPQQAGQEGGGQDQRATQVAEVRQQAEDLMQSPEFQNMLPEQQQQAMAQIREQLSALTQAT